MDCSREICVIPSSICTRVQSSTGAAAVCLSVYLAVHRNLLADQDSRRPRAAARVHTQKC